METQEHEVRVPVRVPLDKLSLWERNPRRIQPERFEALKLSLSEDPAMMDARPLIALQDGRVIAGNMRLRAAQDLGWEDIPVVYVDMDDERATTWAIRDNVPYGEWEDAGLAELLRELQGSDVDLALTGIAQDDIEALFAAIPDPDAIPPEEERGTDLSLADVSIGDPKHECERGDIWMLGTHRLVVAGVYDQWEEWVGFLEPGMLFVPYPTPTLPLTVRAESNPMLMVQPDPWLAGHVLDKYAAVRGDETVAKVKR